ncbi:MAG: hypothetical protein JKY60_11145 [Kordiimonadaceae bacterium]|nr:hypothetical protein [Kordiimonadaceae bacterium]
MNGVRKNAERLQRELNKLEGVRSSVFAANSIVQRSHKTIDITSGHNGVVATSTLYKMSIDQGYMDFFKIPMLAGRDFSSDRGTDLCAKEAKACMTSVIITLNTAQALGYGVDPNSAIGQLVGNTINDIQITYRIIGIIGNLITGGYKEAPQSLIFFPSFEGNNRLFLEIDDAGGATIKAINDIWKANIENWDLIIYPLEAQITGYAHEEQRTLSLIKLGAMISLALASIGMLSLSRTVGRQFAKEVAIRKVHGATTRAVLLTLIYRIGWPSLVGALIFVTVGIFLANQWLDVFIFRLDFSELIVSAISAIVILSLIFVVFVGFSLWRFAKMLPIEALRAE